MIAQETTRGAKKAYNLALSVRTSEVPSDGAPPASVFLYKCASIGDNCNEIRINWRSIPKTWAPSESARRPSRDKRRPRPLH